ncbi:hypothetical protein G5714_009042 [Onychostoma macrolepis]|uniref:Uncharacterized protein n=1 Tax=Onychostoma macrolepis TaxID=369639 RepID=A0A7J6CRA7_9TELE|nr:hypothetical protein G5714_009042 [Onychostoma macrolepis]
MLLCPDCNAKMQYNLVVVFLSALFETVHGLYGYVQIQCRVPDSQQNIEFIFSVTCNMIEYLRYNSTEDKAIVNYATIALYSLLTGLYLEKAMTCAYDFYPKPIKLMWMRDDAKMKADGDWQATIKSTPTWNTSPNVEGRSPPVSRGGARQLP